MVQPFRHMHEDRQQGILGPLSAVGSSAVFQKCFSCPCKLAACEFGPHLSFNLHSRPSGGSRQTTYKGSSHTLGYILCFMLGDLPPLPLVVRGRVRAAQWKKGAKDPIVKDQNTQMEKVQKERREILSPSCSEKMPLIFLFLRAECLYKRSLDSVL